MSQRGMFALSLLLVLTSTLPAAAAMIPFTMGEMVAESESVVQGRVVSMNSHWLDGTGSIIVTDVAFAVDEVWMGNQSPGDQLTLQVAGGEVGEIGMQQEHAPQFRIDEEAVVFLWTRPDGRLDVFNAEQGKYTVLGSTVIGFRHEPLDLADFRADFEQAKRFNGR